MAQEPEKKPASPTSLADQISQRQAVVDKLSDEYKKNPTPELKAELDRKSDTVLYLKNIAKGDPRQRAKRAAETARVATLDRAVKQVSN
jgi:hypothetical protein